MKFDEFSEEKLADILITSPNLCGLVDCSRIKDKIDVLRVCAVHPEYCAKLTGGESWWQEHGYVWRGLSGPVVVITVNNWRQLQNLLNARLCDRGAWAKCA